MKTLLLLRGVPGSGKSTWIKENNLENYTISSDELRIKYAGFEYDLDGKIKISNKKEKLVWDTLFNLLEERMQKGLFTIIDATHNSKNMLIAYNKLIEKYRYNVFVKEFDIELEKALLFNKQREEYKQVQNEVIERMYKKIEKEDIPKTMTKINDIKEIENYPVVNLDNYEEIVVVGDVHSCYTVLNEAIPIIKDNTFYIFVGDLFDRGIENTKTYEYFKNIIKNKNVAIIEGNHDRNLIEFAFEIVDKTKRQTEATIKELFDDYIIRNKYTRKDLYKAFKGELRDFLKRFKQLFLFEFKGQKYIITHGGLSFIPNKLLYLNNSQIIKGIGDYETDLGTIYDENYKKGKCNDFIQIHGHRGVPSGKYSYCLEGQVEYGGNLLLANINENGIKIEKYKNNVYKVFTDEEIKEELKKDGNFITENTEINKLINSKLVKTKKLDNNLLSLNFTEKAFKKALWNDITIKARGLFVDRNTGDVKIRSYDKFFNYNQTENTKRENLRNLKFPCIVKRKENGFLGLLAFVNGELTFATKSTTGGEFVPLFKEVYYKEKQEIREKIEDYLKNNNVTMLFEVIHPRDKHLVDYNNEYKLFILDIVPNKLHLNGVHIDKEFSQKEKFNNLPNEVKYKTCDIKHKAKFIREIETVDILKTYDELLEFIDNHLYEENKEGYIITDENGFTFKLKNDWYNNIKKLRYKFFAFLEGREIIKENDFETTFFTILDIMIKNNPKVKEWQFLDIYNEIMKTPIHIFKPIHNL